MSKVAYVVESRCDKSPACPAKRICPQKAIYQEKGTGVFAFLGGGVSKVDESKCTGCGICINYCPGGALKMVKRKLVKRPSVKPSL